VLQGGAGGAEGQITSNGDDLAVQNFFYKAMQEQVLPCFVF